MTPGTRCGRSAMCARAQWRCSSARPTRPPSAVPAMRRKMRRLYSVVMLVYSSLQAVVTYICAVVKSSGYLVHMCNKLASRHVRVGLADPNKLVRCDICENSPAFFYCEIDGTSLCLSCDMAVHVGGKRTHGRYLLLRQRVEFPGDKPGHIEDVAMQQIEPGDLRDQNKPPHSVAKEQMANHHNLSDDPASHGNCNGQGNIDSKLFDLNMRPARNHGQGSSSQTQGVDLSVNNHDSSGVVPTCNFERDSRK